MHAPEQRRRGTLGRWALAAVILVITTTGSVRAQVVVDPDLQNRILERSDGALFIYRDGLKYPVQVADVDDDLINSVPDGDPPVGQLDQFFAPPSTPPDTSTSAPAAPASPPAPVVVPGPYIAVANPAPGDSLVAGGLDIQGKAFDPVATPDQGTGIDRVQIFLEDRDRGGLHLADARLGFSNPAAAPGSQFATAGWDAIVNLTAGTHTLFIYARSWVTGKETTVEVPIRVF